MSEEKVLTKEIAEQFLKDDSVKLETYSKIDDDAAEALSHSSGTLFLDGLTELSDAAAESLASTKQSMFLRGIKKLSVNAAKSFSKHQHSNGKQGGGGNYFLFNGLTELPECLAERLSKETTVDLPNIKSISPTAAESLSWQDYHYAKLNLSGLEELCDDSAENLSWHCGKLDISGV